MPSIEELTSVGAVVGIDDDEITEALTPHARPVLSIRPAYSWLVLRTVRHDRALRRLMLGELSVVAGRNFVVTIRYGQASPLAGLRRRLEHDAIEAEREVFSEHRARPAKPLLEEARDALGTMVQRVHTLGALLDAAINANLTSRRCRSSRTRT
jgi:Mg2+ and Co2+ transporter CorA